MMNTEKNKLRRSLRDPKPNSSYIHDSVDKKKTNYVVKRGAIKSSKKDVSGTSQSKSTKPLKPMGKQNEASQYNVGQKNETNVKGSMKGRICNKKFLKKKFQRCGHFIIDCSQICESIRININDLNKFIKDQLKNVEERNNGNIEVKVKNMKIFIDTDFFVEKARFKELTKKYLKKKKLHNWIRVTAGKNKYNLSYFRAAS